MPNRATTGSPPSNGLDQPRASEVVRLYRHKPRAGQQIQALARQTETVDRQRLVEALAVEFGGGDRTVRTVARQAGDLADSGRLTADIGYELTTERVLDNLRDAPATYTLRKRWNWWVGSLELAYGDTYRRFRVRETAD